MKKRDHWLELRCNAVAIAVGWFARFEAGSMTFPRIAYSSDRAIELVRLERAAR